MILYRPVGTKELELIQKSGCRKFPKRLPDQYFNQFEVHTVGASYHQELWVPAETLEDFNAQIIGEIRIISEFSEN